MSPSRTTHGPLAWTFEVLVIVAITLAIYLGHWGATPLVVLYVPALLVAAYLGGRALAATQLVLIGAAYAAVLAIDGPQGAIAWWMLTMSVLAIATELVTRMRDRIGVLVFEVDRAIRTDALTGLLNRRAFDIEFDLELERSRRSARPMSLMVADLDHFKEVNDKQGHHAGDAAIERFAEILDSAARRVDVAVRLGGEEFGLLLPGTDEAGAYMLAERIRDVVREAFRTEVVPLTISFGIASYPAHGYEVDSLMGAADHALYTAKALGRDRTVICNRAIATAIATVVDRPAAQKEGRAAA